MVWEIYMNGKHLHIDLNGECNSILDSSHENFEVHKKTKREEIEYFKTFTKSTVSGMELLA